MRKLVVIGAGGHCKSVLDVLLASEEYDNIVLVGEDDSVGRIIYGCKVVGTDDDLQKIYERGFRYAFVAVGSIKSTALRRKLWGKANKTGYKMINVIDVSSKIASDVSLGCGIFIGKNAIVNAGAKIKDMAIINSGAIVEHDCMVGEFSHISVGAVLCGTVKVGADCFVGANATVIQGCCIQDGSIIGAGEMVKAINTKVTIDQKTYITDSRKGIETAKKQLLIRKLPGGEGWKTPLD